MSTPTPLPKHTCRNGRGPVFGRLSPDTCERCRMLANGECEPVQWSPSRRQQSAADDATSAAAIRAHFASDRHRSGGCGAVCTYGDW